MIRARCSGIVDAADGVVTASGVWVTARRRSSGGRPAAGGILWAAVTLAGDRPRRLPDAVREIGTAACSSNPKRSARSRRRHRSVEPDVLISGWFESEHQSPMGTSGSTIRCLASAASNT